MFSVMKLPLHIAYLASMALSSPLALRSSEPNCTEFMIPVTISAENLVIPPTNPLSYSLVSGTFNIGARYCEPEVVSSSDDRDRFDTLQFLVHGLTYTRNYWSGDGAPGQGYQGDKYSWIAFANSQGFPTLSIDRICNGLSDHPDPIAVCQTAVNVEVIHQIVLLARAGSLPTPAASRPFKKIVYVGHSYGSFLGNYYNAEYPGDTDATILTGWNNNLNFTTISATFDPYFIPAAVVQPDRFGDLAPGYLELDNYTTFQTMFYGGQFDPNFAAFDYSVRGPGTVGELIGVELMAFVPAPAYVQPVFIMTGQHDFLMCETSDGTFDCPNGASIVAKSESLYPNAAVFEAFVVPDSGHCWAFCEAADVGFAVCHAWLWRQGF